MLIATKFRGLAIASMIALCSSAVSTFAATGLTTTPGIGEDGPVTIFYPTKAASQVVRRARMELLASPDAPPQAGNGRLIVISHGSGSSPWVHADLARALVDAGFVVAFPEHKGDNYKHNDTPGPDSWKLRPAEVSRAIDAISIDPRFAPLLDLKRVGMYGMSAGGHTALTLAGGQWSPGNFKRHCESHIEEDFYTCVGLAVRQTGGIFDGLKRSIALAIIGHRYSDDTPQQHKDPRIVAIVAGVPAAADFEMASLTHPRVPLGLITAGKDAWLIPKFHSDRVLAACRTCDHIADLPQAGHGALLSPLPPELGGLLKDLISDPREFDRQILPEIDLRIIQFFTRHIVH